MSMILRSFDGHEIGQRQTDGYMDATAMCQANGKKWSHYWSNQSTQEFVQALAADAGIPASALVEVRRGGTVNEQGTYVHPKLAIHLAQWCSARFAVLVSGWVLDLLTTGRATMVPEPVDPVLAMIETARATYLKQIEMQKQLDDANRRLADAERKVDRALTEATAAHQTAESNYGWYTILAWCNRIGRRVSVVEAGRHGRAISNLMRSRGIEKQYVRDQRFNKVGLYPESILAEYFGDTPDGNHA